MKIVLVGYGKMGKEIEKILVSRGHEVIGKATKDNPLSSEMVKNADAAIDFSTPDSVLDNINFLITHKIPSIIGTTGWNESYDEVKHRIDTEDGAMVHASNFSVGVNLFFKLNEQLAKLMEPYKEYTPEMTEIHHTEKLDAPSGTAISLATDLLQNHTQFNDWYCPQNDKKSKSGNKLKIEAVREHDVKGTHTISYQSKIDTISITHEAHNREGFALGAVISAEWIQNKKGIFTMKDVLALS